VREEIAAVLFREKEIAALEAILFMAREPLSTARLAELLEVSAQDAEEFLVFLTARYEQEDSGLSLIRCDEGARLATKKETAPYIQALYRQSPQVLSQAALEVLAVVAYRQPVTKGEIDLIRGVQSDTALRTLLEKSLVREFGRRESAGRPFLYSTTTEFLRYFNLTALTELPPIDDLTPTAPQEASQEKTGFPVDGGAEQTAGGDSSAPADSSAIGAAAQELRHDLNQRFNFR
jgi:segregation and condensation protein B